MSTRHRTCIATRQVFPDTQLLRCVLDPTSTARVIADPARRLPGRGAWISPTWEAFELAEKRRAFSRALRVSTPVDLSPVRQYIAEHADRHADGPEIVRKTEH
ncbi:YlxR family protein [Corynebacterium cystitidis]|uniref:YlxR family protein n=1 Tax=Corynebacterium cystitidis TaxID=35757 RepID=UPI00211EB296|nr:YlxR family protein [Corynebacterium cystitidis]